MGTWFLGRKLPCPVPINVNSFKSHSGLYCYVICYLLFADYLQNIYLAHRVIFTPYINIITNQYIPFILNFLIAQIDFIRSEGAKVALVICSLQCYIQWRLRNFYNLDGLNDWQWVLNWPQRHSMRPICSRHNWLRKVVRKPAIFKKVKQ